jgi:ATP-dependent helicase/nuclease subunit A
MRGTLAPSLLFEDADEPPVLSPLAPDMTPARYGRGRLIHKLLELLPALPQDLRAEAARKFLARPAHGLTREAQEEIASAALAVLEAEEFAPLFAPESRAEVAIVGNVTLAGRNWRVNGIVDRLALVNDRVLVIDYKTNRPPPQTLDDVPRLYLRQMALYRAVLAEAYGRRTIECALLWTEGPRLMRLSPGTLDKTLAGLARLDGRKAAS